MSKRRLHPPETIEAVLHLLRHYQGEGWGMVSAESRVEWGTVEPKGQRLPLSTTITVRLVPGREP